jgi:hypothetical protein
METDSELSFDKLLRLIQEERLAIHEDRLAIQEERLAARERGKKADLEVQDLWRLMRETDKQMKETGKKIGALGDSIGKLVEHIMSAGIVDKFRALGYAFTRAHHRTSYKDSDGQFLAEVDILLENGDYILPVEVKTTLRTEDIKHHVRRMEVLRNYSTEHGDFRAYIGGVTGGVVSDAARDFALKKGFYVIELSGDTLRIKAPDHVQVWKAGAEA